MKKGMKFCPNCGYVPDNETFVDINGLHHACSCHGMDKKVNVMSAYDSEKHYDNVMKRIKNWTEGMT